MNEREYKNLVNYNVVEKLYNLGVECDTRVMFLFSKIYYDSGFNDIVESISSKEEKNRVFLKGFKLFCYNYNICLDKLDTFGRELILYRYGFKDGNFKTFEDIYNIINYKGSNPDFEPCHVEGMLNSHLGKLASIMGYKYVKGNLYLRKENQKTNLHTDEQSRKQKEGVQLLEAELRKHKPTGKITAKELQEFAASTYSKKRGIAYYSLKGWFLSYNVSYVSPTRNTIKHIVDLRLNEVVSMIRMKRFDPRGLENV